MPHPHNLQRFLEAQSPVYDQVVKELRQGEKRTHWMWFIFPQIEGLGSSPMARKYAIQFKAEARAYLEHEILGTRLRECAEILLGLNGRTVGQIFGPVDKLKLRSSLTLFESVADPEETRFSEALEKYYEEQKDSATLAILMLSQSKM